MTMGAYSPRKVLISIRLLSQIDPQAVKGKSAESVLTTATCRGFRHWALCRANVGLA